MLQPELLFNKEKHIYSVGGIELPSVTTILDRFFPMSVRIPPMKLEAARIRGLHIHSICEYLDLGTLDIQSVKEKYLWALNAYKTAKAEYNIETKMTEQLIYHKILRYAGRLDLIGLVGGDLSIIDFKTGATICKKDHYQQAAYFELARHVGIKVKKRYILHLREKFPNGYKLIPAKDKNDFVIWTSALNLYTAQEKIN